MTSNVSVKWISRFLQLMFLYRCLPSLTMYMCKFPSVCLSLLVFLSVCHYLSICTFGLASIEFTVPKADLHKRRTSSDSGFLRLFFLPFTPSIEMNQWKESIDVIRGCSLFLRAARVSFFQRYRTVTLEPWLEESLNVISFNVDKVHIKCSLSHMEEGNGYVKRLQFFFFLWYHDFVAKKWMFSCQFVL